VVKGANWIDLA